MSAMGIKCYLIIYFSLFNTFVLVSVSWLENYINNGGKKQIPYEVIIKENKIIEIIYPGIFDMNVFAL
jgi:penicillin-binding protein-related factor A (putative recombinase)